MQTDSHNEVVSPDHYHGRRQAWARGGGTCLPLEMHKGVVVTVTNCTLEYLNRQ